MLRIGDSLKNQPDAQRRDEHGGETLAQEDDGTGAAAPDDGPRAVPDRGLRRDAEYDRGVEPVFAVKTKEAPG